MLQYFFFEGAAGLSSECLLNRKRRKVAPWMGSHFPTPLNFIVLGPSQLCFTYSIIPLSRWPISFPLCTPFLFFKKYTYHIWISGNHQDEIIFSDNAELLSWRSLNLQERFWCYYWISKVFVKWKDSKLHFFLNSTFNKSLFHVIHYLYTLIQKETLNKLKWFATMCRIQKMLFYAITKNNME